MAGSGEIEVELLWQPTTASTMLASRAQMARDSRGALHRGPHEGQAGDDLEDAQRPASPRQGHRQEGGGEVRPAGSRRLPKRGRGWKPERWRGMSGMLEERHHA